MEPQQKYLSDSSEERADTNTFVGSPEREQHVKAAEALNVSTGDGTSKNKTCNKSFELKVSKRKITSVASPKEDAPKAKQQQLGDNAQHS